MRERKPPKKDICHLNPNHLDHMDDDRDSARSSEDNHQSTSRLHRQNSLIQWLSVRPELTVTFNSFQSLIQSASLPYSLVLKPEQYETLAPQNPLYATYVFFPSVGVFVHPLAIPPELAPFTPIPISPSE